MICARPGCGAVFCDDGADNYAPGSAATPRRYCSARCKKKSKPGDVAARAAHRTRKVCEEQAKPKYPDEDTALRVADWMSRNRDRVLYPYECIGHWHLTSKPPAREDGQPAWTLDTLARRWNERC